MLNEKGFITLVLDITVSCASTPTEMLHRYTQGELIRLQGLPCYALTRPFIELRSQVKYAMNPFAPVFIARSKSCLVTQNYISSYPASGLFLVSPPLPTEGCEEFTYEPEFPIAIMDTPERIEEQKKTNRLCKEGNPYVDIIPVEELEGQPLLNAVDNWLDELGV